MSTSRSGSRSGSATTSRCRRGRSRGPQLKRGAALVLYTDGLLDAYRQADSLTSVGLDELLEVATGALVEGESLDDLLETIVARAPVRAVDDTALVVLRVGEVDEDRAT